MKYGKVNIGEIIYQILRRKHISQSEFGRAMNIQRQNLKATVFSKQSLDTNFLIAASEFLNEDLFCYYRPVDMKEEQVKKNPADDVKATLTIELPESKKEEVLKIALGEKAMEILGK